MKTLSYPKKKNYPEWDVPLLFDKILLTLLSISLKSHYNTFCSLNNFFAKYD